MRKTSFTILFLAGMLQSYGQSGGVQKTIAAAIRTNFNYDTLSSLSCLNARPGVYAIHFKVGKKRRSYDFRSVNDSDSVLHSFFIDAIRKSLQEKSAGKYRKGHYIQLICFTNTLHCNPFRNQDNELISIEQDSVGNGKTNYFKEIAEMLSNQLISLENSITRLQNNKIGNKKLLYLPMALINNDNPAEDRSKPGFKNDVRRAHVTNEQLKQLEMQIGGNKNEKKD